MADETKPNPQQQQQQKPKAKPAAAPKEKVAKGPDAPPTSRSPCVVRVHDTERVLGRPA